MKRETVTTWQRCAPDSYGDPQRPDGNGDLPVGFDPPRPEGNGWRCVAMTANAVALFWTWEREVSDG